MKTLLVYYSYTGQTKLIVDKIKNRIDCNVVELKPVIPFSNDYQEVVDEYQNNESDKKCVEIEELNVNLDAYDKIIIGTPVWWYSITPVLREFLNKYDLSGKKVYPFATNAGWLGRTFKEIESICNGEVHTGLNIKFSEDYKEQKCLTSEEEINNWINNIKSSEY